MVAIVFESAYDLLQPALKGGKSDAPVIMSTDVNSRDANTFSLRFSIRSDIVEQLRWQQGDRLGMFFDKNSRMVLIKRSAKGWRLLAGSKNRKNFQLRWGEGLPSNPEPADCIDVKVTEDGLMFRLPHSARFGKCCRAEEPIEAPKTAALL